MKVYKFGGASIKDAPSIVNVGNILKREKGPLVIVVSALGKMTNKLESLVSDAFKKDLDQFLLLWEQIKIEHLDVAKELDIMDFMISEFSTMKSPIQSIIDDYILSDKDLDYDELYDQLIYLGEFLSTKLVYAYLNKHVLQISWLDARNFILTDSNFRMASIQWDETLKATNNILRPILSDDKLLITQGFIGRCNSGKTTSLGREGSDYTAAILAFCLNAESVTVWKDVPGVLTADPRKVNNAQLIEHLSFRDAIELTYYGAQVIHPKTIQPLQKKDIPLFVRSFIDYDSQGTKIDNIVGQKKPAMIVITENQYLVQISSKDYSFIAEKHLSTIFSLLNQYRIRVNLMRNSAISFSVSVTAEEERFMSFINELDPLFLIDYEKDLCLITIRHYDDLTIDRFKVNKKIIFEEKHGITHQMILKNI